MIPAVSPAAYDAARKRAVLLDRSHLARIVVSGKDRASYLHGLLTNDVAALKPGDGCYAAYLTPQGRMITDMWVHELGDVMLLTLPRDVKDLVLAKLDQFIFTEDVQLGDVSDTFSSAAVVGPRGGRIVTSVLAGDEALNGLRENGAARATFIDQPAIVVHVSDTGEPGYDVIVPAAHVPALLMALRAAGAVDIDVATAEALRIEAGIPRFHQDMDEDTIPIEAGIESRAISFTKGCYVGQEVIIRVLHRGHGRVARKLVGLVCDGHAVPGAGDKVVADGRDIGHLTSSSWSPALERPIALAYVHRDFIEPGTNVTVNGTTAAVAALPFVARE